MGTYDSYQSNNIIDQDLQDTERLPQLTDTAWRYQDYPAYATGPRQYNYGDYEQAETEPNSRDKLLRRMAIITSTLAIISAGAVVGKNYLASHGGSMAQPAITASDSNTPANDGEMSDKAPDTPVTNDNTNAGNDQGISLPTPPDPKNVLPSFETLKPTDYKCYLIDDKGNKVEKVYHFDDDKYRQQRYTNSDYTADIKRSSVDDIVNMYHEFTGNSGGFQDVMMYEWNRNSSGSSPIMTALANAGYCYSDHQIISNRSIYVVYNFNEGVYKDSIKFDSQVPHNTAIFITSNGTIDLDFHQPSETDGHRIIQVDKPFVIAFPMINSVTALVESDELPTVSEAYAVLRPIMKAYDKEFPTEYNEEHVTPRVFMPSQEDL